MQGDYRPLADYNGYQLFDVYRKLAPQDVHAVIDFWRRNDALPGGLADVELRRRAQQVVVMVLRDGDIVALTSVYVAVAPRDGQPYYFYRKFVEPGHRIYLMWREMLAQSYATLKHWEPSVLLRKPLGIIVVPENRKLTRRSVLRAGNKIGFFTVGYLPNGDPVYGRKFDETVKENLSAQGVAQIR
ncbi:hypothetical protein [uncultured Microbulbifer sp.]|uniref:hypothetical protein n=1 Tax=uncultured Microbulbifer sp. TaxID=348147 RepID=UPI0026332F15|nr:hypothetical protein [uncultured Microbulbifer sp.]